MDINTFNKTKDLIRSKTLNKNSSNSNKQKTASIRLIGNIFV